MDYNTQNPFDFNPHTGKPIRFTNFKDFFDRIFTMGQPNRVNKKGKSRRKPWWFILLITLVIMFVYFFFALPSLSPMGMELYFTIIIGIVLFWFLMALFGRKPKTAKSFLVSLGIIAVCILFPAIMRFIASPIFMASQYKNLIEVREGVFDEEIDQIHISQVPVVDREAAAVIGEKEMGAVGELVSQFDIAAYYSQINIAGKPYRVSPLFYNDFFKYLWNFRDGIQYYVSVDMNTQEGDLVKLDEAIMYSNSDYLMRDFDRHLRFQYPFALFGETNFEIDDNGKAWYVTPKLTKRIALFSAPDTQGIYLTDAHTGESTYYDKADIPEWVDRAYPAENILDQLNWHGRFVNGFWNSIFGQRNVTSTTEGYNYISIGTDLHLITGVTSVRSDTSNLGFYYVNLRTKEATFYPQPSATEYAAMSSARGKVQEKRYDPTFPVILNIQGRPVYFMSLKDQSLTAKMFALVDAEQFTNVVVGDTVPQVMAKYYETNPNKDGPDEIEGEFTELTLTHTAGMVEDGNTVFYFQVKEDPKVYRADPETLGPVIAFLEPGQKIKVIAQEGEDYNNVLKIEFNN